ncbi:MAG: electron transport complex subunit RsxG [Candidatus Dactylopiibacterium sp.]|nr:electron transport complex subunit RsxG [Candidatus Dactylopiibacterium sp.]
MNILSNSRHAWILGAFCLVFALVLALTHQVAASDIEARAQEDRMRSLEQVLPADMHDNDILSDTLDLADGEGKPRTVFVARRGGAVSGAAFQVQSPGYAGPIRLMMGVQPDGRIIGVRVLAHKETPGLGDRIEVKKGDWILRFSGLSLDKPAERGWRVKKDGGDFDQFAGATITPRAVVRAVHEGLRFFAANRDRILASPAMLAKGETP